MVEKVKCKAMEIFVLGLYLGVGIYAYTFDKVAGWCLKEDGKNAKSK